MRPHRLLPTVLGLVAVSIASLIATNAPAQAALDAIVNRGASAVAPARRVNPPEKVDPVKPLPNRPRVFMALHGNNQIANDPGLDGQWRYVQENVDGIWGNTVGMTTPEIGRLIRKVRTRQFIAEAGLPATGTPFSFPETMSDFRFIERENPGIELNREGIALYTDRPSHWDGKSIDQMRNEVQRISPPGDPLYPEVYTGWQPYNFLTGNRQIPSGSSADRALDASDGFFVECPADACADPNAGLGPSFRASIQEAHANGRPFIWFASHPSSRPGPGWLSQFQATYNSIRDAGLWLPGDIVVVISYANDPYPVVPETVNGQPADTIMGAIYWALQQ